MTGFGKAESTITGKKISVEIKTLNSKQLDISIKLPFVYREKEIEIKNEAGRIIQRGKADVFISVEIDEDQPVYQLNTHVIKQYVRQLSEIAYELNIEATEQLIPAVMRLPDAVASQKEEVSAKEWEVLFKTLHDALDQVKSFRVQEGKALEADIKARINAILSKLGEVGKFEKERIEQIKSRITQSLRHTDPGEPVDPSRFEQELIYYLEKIDITEEQVRLTNHIKYFLDTMAADEPVGKKIGFITQEMGREINTLGSKANHFEIQRIVVEMKDELEKIKEQIQNIL